MYDANGRAVAVTANNGTSVQYSYNALGHASQVSGPLASGQLAIFTFMPTHGEAGTQVTIRGQGFDSDVANDTVSFNGTVATVLSASSTQLVTTVPSGAMTGPISVTIAGQTVVSATPFMVDDTGMPPTITQVSPQVVAMGDTVTVTGAHLDPVAGSTAVQMGDRSIPALAGASDPQLQYLVSGNAVTGYVTVETPYGSAMSPTPVVILPNGVSVSSVTSSGNAVVNGTGVNLSMGASGQIGAVTFTAPQSGWVSLQTSAISTSASSINYTVYAPGNGVVQQGTVSSASPSIHLPHLVAGATYVLLVQPIGGDAQMTVGVESNALLAINVAATVVTSVPAQSRRVLFNAVAGQNLTFEINSTATTPAGQSVTYTVYTPTGANYASTTVGSSGVINLGALLVTGTYQVVSAPNNGTTGAMQIEVTTGVGGTLSGAAQTYTTNLPGQNVYLSFTANQGDNLELTLSNLSVAGNDHLHVNAYSANGTNISSYDCYVSWLNCRSGLWNLAAGSYTVVVSPPDTNSKLSFGAQLASDIIGPTLTPNASVLVNLNLPYVERYTFNANAGDTYALVLSNVMGQPMTVLVYRPDVGQIRGDTTYTSFRATNSQTLNLQNLPVTGTYTLVAYGDASGPSSSARLTLASGVTPSVGENAPSQSYTTPVTGQNVYLSFTANQGDNLELTLSNLSVAGNDHLHVNAYNASGVNISSYDCYNSWVNCRSGLWNLAAGTYTVVISPPDTNSTLSFGAQLTSDIIGPALTPNTTIAVNLDLPHVERYTFNANAGDTYALQLSNVTGQPMTVLVYRPDVGQIRGDDTYTSFTTSSSQTLNLPNLPVSGTYTLVLYTGTGGPSSSAQLTLIH
ncbi:IPT/TIG domain-containing protein [Burkholderia pseudomallei]|uniref:IPT/TIG domain-containing protein n=1 Tax=Burkholderia pseudomallei TaxID=28450 RepID=UPI002180B98A|nr:IPT/TIG domain-containing protein [Burkholderia pseudomallei]